MADMSHLFAEKIVLVEDAAKKYFSSPEISSQSIKRLYESINYSLLSPGKRFRPVLSLLVAEALEIDLKQVIPFGLSLEFIHTYSLIHDDLPCMDDDNERRGRPTNHIQYGEAIALLAGDSLLTEAFLNLSRSYSSRPEIACQLVECLGRASGVEGMIAGQMMDIDDSQDFSKDQMELLHKLKTGALITAASEGAAICGQVSDVMKKNMTRFGECLGLAFQLADDIDDYDEKNPEPTNMVNLLGLSKTSKYLQELTQESIEIVGSFGEKGRALREIAQFNQDRVNQFFNEG
ncbi:MAG: polyprenyl synthetase family protein [Bdellovibrionales bacterium]|nr:polyprenyl synthetase family protein [Bdellovibrionales bacterium]